MDYVELDAASNRGIDEARDLLERAAYKPSIGRFKVFMIDEAHQLTKDAFSALLKTLEEPPEYLKFVLATTDPEKMRPRCRRLCSTCGRWRPRWCSSTCSTCCTPKACRDAGALRLLARAARGSTRAPLTTVPSPRGGRLDEAGVRAMLGAVDQPCGGAGILALRDGRRCWHASMRCSLGVSADGRWSRWRGCCSRWPCSRPSRARYAADPIMPTPCAWPRRCLPTKPSCSTASCCKVAGAAADVRRDAALTMVPSHAGLCAATSRRPSCGTPWHSTGTSTGGGTRPVPPVDAEPPPWSICRLRKRSRQCQRRLRGRAAGDRRAGARRRVSATPLGERWAARCRI